MHPKLDSHETPPGDAERAAFRHPSPGELLLVADWRRFVFLHFALPAKTLAPHVPFALDLRDGRAFVSLVSFSLERMRPGRFVPPALGRLLMRPISDHPFLNVRTYVRGAGGPGILFLAEWISNPLSLRLGPRTYGLPYRLGKFRIADGCDTGLRQIAIRDDRVKASLSITVPTTPDHEPRPCEPGSLAEFLVERYVGYTHHRGRGRFFHIAHPPWRVSRIDLARFDTTLVERAFPWFRDAEFVGAQVSEGFREVQMGRPHGCEAIRAKTAPAVDPCLVHARPPA